MNVTDLEKLGEAMADPVAAEWDKKTSATIPFTRLR
tara:strand:+ start:1102 stop:1209 length:108 start_codon:yes stop_codon:yes gene_type:complete